MGRHAIRLGLSLLAVLGAASWPCAAASWSGQPYSVVIPTHITGRGQSVSDSSTVVSLAHTESCNIIISAPGGTQTLKLGSSTLATYYKLTGLGLSNGDSDWVPADIFAAKSYHIPGVGPGDDMTLSVKGVAPADTAPAAGVYSASITLTATW
jgi:hypothetical protein